MDDIYIYIWSNYPSPRWVTFTRPCYAKDLVVTISPPYVVNETRANSHRNKVLPSIHCGLHMWHKVWKNNWKHHCTNTGVPWPLKITPLMPTKICWATQRLQTWSFHYRHMSPWQLSCIVGRGLQMYHCERRIIFQWHMSITQHSYGCSVCNSHSTRKRSVLLSTNT